MSERQYEFPEDFVWGAAAASYQIEGAFDSDGKGPSVWDMFCDLPGAIYDGHTGRVACDHYRRYPEDVLLMKTLGLGAYRLSFSWPRILPAGVGSPSEKGLDFYDRLIDELLRADVTPWATLFHWDYPLELFHRGGWQNPDSPKWFADYVTLIARRYSDRLRHFFTLNEPQVYIGFGHHQGRHAPGLRLPFHEVLQAGHHTLLAHGLGVRALRDNSKHPLTIGYAPVGLPLMPASKSAEDIALARRAHFEVSEKSCWNNAWWMDPVYLGQYPEQAWEFFGSDVPKVGSDDLKTIAQPLDVFAVNIYQGTTVRADATSPLGYSKVAHGLDVPRTAFNWPVTPEAMYWGPLFYYERYGLPVLIAENGLSCRDWVAVDGCVHDESRIDFLRRYLREFRRAGRDGVPLRGYFQWSILDNFEWGEGYKERFGLVHVDYQTQKRTPKDSFYWYQKLIAERGRSLG
jgi:beta-glucosidase